MYKLNSKTTALVLIDLQQGIVGMPWQPRTGKDVVANAAAVAQRFRDAHAVVVLVRVAFAEDFADAPPQGVDQPMQRPAHGLPVEWSTLVPGLIAPGDLIVTKRQWSAFHGTELDLQMRRRGVRTIVLGGIATNFGVESTARQAWEHNYDVVVLEDLCASASAELHEMTLAHVFPRFSRVTSSNALELSAVE
ncbi:MAG: hydrolase [Pseudomonadota bacterium]|nr:hydrolase [Pseudomonadota bacterium]